MKRRKLASSGWELQASLGLITFTFLIIVIISTDRADSAIVPPPWSDPQKNPCARMPGGWQLLYWPPLKKCFKIFQVGFPCPETMELSPAASSKYTSKNGPAAECRCPPGTALSAETNKCHSVFEKGPCKAGQFFSPMAEEQIQKSKTGNRWGMCKQPSQCPAGMLFWPKDGKCYSMYTKGPCAKGKLLIQDEHGLAQCRCESVGELGEYFYETDETCHEHFTKGPCPSPGHLFLPGGRCDCMENLPHYHEGNGMCFELGSPGPCPPGHIFIVPENRTANYKRAKCQCKEGYVLWNDGICYRLYTRGPCAPNEFLFNATCVRNFCGKNRLYFPEEKSCYRIGSQGPCDLYQVVVFDFTARPSIDGVSYNGMCGCSGVIMNLDQQCNHANTDPDANTCESSPGMVEMDGNCYKLYSRGPCGPGQWLEPIKSSTLSMYPKSDEYFVAPMTSKAKCVCRPGYTSYETPDKGLTGCNAPTVGLARYLNRQKYQFGPISIITAPEA